MHIRQIPRFVTIILLILILLITVGTIYSITTESQKALKAAVQEKLIAVASATAAQVDGDTFSQIKAGDENTPGFIGIRDQLRAVQKSTPDVRYVYSLTLNGSIPEFVVDADYGFAANGLPVGLPYPQAEPELFAGFVAPSADKDFTSSKSETVLSGFAPIKNHSGIVVGVIGVDMDSSTAAAEINRLNLTLYSICMIAVILVVLAIVTIELRRAEDERKVKESEKKYRLLFERAGDAIILLEAEGTARGTIVSANTAAAVMHGYADGGLAGKNIADLNPPADAGEVTRRLDIISKGTWLNAEGTHTKKDGTTFPVEISAGLLDLGTKKYVLIIDRDISERKNYEEAMYRLTQKLSLLNSVTFSDIQNTVFALAGYISFAKTGRDPVQVSRILDKEDELMKVLSRSLDFAKAYQDLGKNPPRWQQAHTTFLLALSHLDFSAIERTVCLDDLEIYADILLERVFLALAENVLQHAHATQVTVGYDQSGEGLVLFFEDNGRGIQERFKEKIFERGFGAQKDMGLFLVREILSITGIIIRETGKEGSGARFEMIVPKGAYRIGDKK